MRKPNREAVYTTTGAEAGTESKQERKLRLAPLHPKSLKREGKRRNKNQQARFCSWSLSE